MKTPTIAFSCIAVLLVLIICGCISESEYEPTSREIAVSSASHPYCDVRIEDVDGHVFLSAIMLDRVDTVLNRCVLTTTGESIWTGETRTEVRTNQLASITVNLFFKAAPMTEDSPIPTTTNSDSRIRVDISDYIRAAFERAETSTLTISIELKEQVLWAKVLTRGELQEYYILLKP